MENKAVVSVLAGAALLISVPFIAGWEGKSNDPYNDLVGVQTVCYGETRVPMRSYSNEECLALLERAVSGFQKEVVKCTPVLKGHPFQLAAASSLAYNIGSSAYCSSTAARKFNAGDFKGGCEAIKMWNKAGGKTVKGLVNRREAEYNLCLTYLDSGNV